MRGPPECGIGAWVPRGGPRGGVSGALAPPLGPPMDSWPLCPLAPSSANSEHHLLKHVTDEVWELSFNLSRAAWGSSEPIANESGGASLPAAVRIPTAEP
jgi:hypothetical protein